MLANGADGNERSSLIAHLLGNQLPQVNEIFPYFIEFLNRTGYAGGPKIILAASIWVHKSVVLKPTFHNVMEKFYNPDFRPFDISIKEFKNTEALKRQVNKWSEEKTQGHIEDCLGSTVIGADTRLILTTALGFEGTWIEPFQDAGVKEFTTLNGDKVILPFMTTNGKQYVKQFENYKLLSVPFAQNEASRFSMLFYLQNNKEGFEDVLVFTGLEEDVLMDVYFPEEQVKVGKFYIPKFSLAVGGPLPLQDDKGNPFDFPLMADSPTGLTSRGGKLKSVLQINETGARVVGVSCFFVDEKPTMPGKVHQSYIRPEDTEIDFVANRPFIFLIRDNKFGRMLFSGALIDPVGQFGSFETISE